MIDILRNIEKSAMAMQDTTSINDSRYNELQQIIVLCHEGMAHFIDDGK